MKKIIRSSSLFLALLLFLANATIDAQSASSAAVMVDGNKAYQNISYLSLGPVSGLSLRDLTHIYNAFLEWKPISAIATLYINNKKIDIKVNDDTVYIDKKRFRLSAKTQLIGNDIFVPVDILSIKDFAEITQADSFLDLRNSILSIQRRSNIYPARYFTRPENTQIVIHTGEPLSYSASKSTNAIVLNVLRGITKNESAQVGNGAVRDILYENADRAAVIRINLSQTPKRVRVTRLTRPDRISVIVEHKKPIDITSVYNSDNTALADENSDVTAFLAPAEELGAARIIKNPPPRSATADDFVSLFSKKEPQRVINSNYQIIEGDSFRTILTPQKKKSANERRIVVIDPGHGGHDPGAIGPAGTNEKDVTLAIAYELKKLFDEDGSYRAILTRSDDRFIPLGTRSDIANKLHADLFVSIHCNANINRNVDGFEIYFLSERATDPSAIATENLENSVLELEGKNSQEKTSLQKMFWSMMLNEYINDSAELCSFIAAETPRRLKIVNRGVKQAGFYVLRGAEMPSVLVESAFISNYSQEAKLKTSAFQILVADSIYEGVIRFFARKDRLTK